MAEIKSTLDLVMERTRHLSQSAEEKAEHQRKDFEKRLQGLLQQYADNSLPADELLERIAALQADLKVDDPTLIVGAVFKRIDPDKVNEQWLKLMSGLMPSACEPLQDILAVYREKQAELLRSSEQQQSDLLLRRYGIQGSAVVPNSRADADYSKNQESLRLDAQSRIEAVLKQI